MLLLQVHGQGRNTLLWLSVLEKLEKTGFETRRLESLLPKRTKYLIQFCRAVNSF